MWLVNVINSRSVTRTFDNGCSVLANQYRRAERSAGNGGGLQRSGSEGRANYVPASLPTMSILDEQLEDFVRTCGAPLYRQTQ